MLTKVVVKTTDAANSARKYHGMEPETATASTDAASKTATLMPMAAPVGKPRNGDVDADWARFDT